MESGGGAWIWMEVGAQFSNISLYSFFIMIYQDSDLFSRDKTFEC